MAHISRSVSKLLQGGCSPVCRHHVRTVMYMPRKIEPEEQKTHSQRIAELNKKDPVLDKDINIGFPVSKLTRSERKKTRREQGQSVTSYLPQLEKSARDRTLVIPLDEVYEGYVSETQATHWKSLAEHYGLFCDLFDNANFYPVVNMDILFDYDGEYVSKVFMGNKLKPSEVKTKPDVHYTAEPDSLWTVAMTAPDSHLQDNNMEYLHWLVGNIPGNDVHKGDELCHYLPPLPVYGTGYHRMVFVLYKQQKQIDFSDIKRPGNCRSLRDRSFSTLEFYRKLQDDMTPAGIQMFQCDWDESVRDTFWNTLEMKEPRYEFKHPPPYHPKQQWYPHKVPFNLYLDRYRDVKDINEEVLRDKLKNVKPFEPPMKEEYPLLNLLQKDLPNGVEPSWLKTKLKHKYLKSMHWKDDDDKYT